MKRAINHYTEIEHLGSQQYRATLYGYPRFYEKDGTFTRATPRFIENAGGYDYAHTEAVHRCGVNTDGTVTLSHPFGGDDHRLVFRLEAIAAFLGGEVVGSRLANPTTVSKLEDNTLLWFPDYFNSLPGVGFGVKVNENQVRFGVRINTAARAALVSYKPSGSTYFALVWSVDPSQLNLTPVEEDGTPFDWNDPTGIIQNEVILKKGASVIQRLFGGCIQVEGSSTPSREYRRKYICRKRGGVYYFIELVPWAALESLPAGPILINAIATYQQGVTGYYSCTDTFVDEYYPAQNFGTENYLLLSQVDAYTRVLVQFQDIPNLGTITAVSLKFPYQIGYDGTGVPVECYGVDEAWTETGATWNDQPGFTSLFCLVSSHITDPMIFSFNSTGVAAVNDDWQGGGASNYGVIICFESDVMEDPIDGTSYVYWGSSEQALTADRPLLTIEYTGDPVTPPDGPTVSVQEWDCTSLTVHVVHNGDGDHIDTEWELLDNDVAIRTEGPGGVLNDWTPTGLIPGTTYVPYVRTEDSLDGWSQWTYGNPVTLWSPPTKPSANIVGGSIQQKIATGETTYDPASFGGAPLTGITWVLEKSDGEGGWDEVARRTNLPPEPIDGLPNTYGHTFIDLEAGTDYRFKVHHRNLCGESISSDWVEFTTREKVDENAIFCVVFKRGDQYFIGEAALTNVRPYPNHA